jgi:hypothetical protein
MLFSSSQQVLSCPKFSSLSILNKNICFQKVPMSQQFKIFLLSSFFNQNFQASLLKLSLLGCYLFPSVNVTQLFLGAKASLGLALET